MEKEKLGLVIGVSGFSWSGSGAVIDYLMEFEANQVYPNEFLIAYHPDGLRDLDVALNNNCAKFLSSGVAIPRFRYIAKTLLSKSTKGKSEEITEYYLNQIIQAKWIGLEQGQILVQNKWLYKHIGLRIREYIINRLPMELCWKYKPYPLSQMEFSICPDSFDNKTLVYMERLFEVMGFNLKKNIVLNQPFPGNNPVPYMKYFPRAKAIVVDRDPRDVFVFLKYVFPGHSYSVPLQDVNVFCSYFENMHKGLVERLDDPDVLYLQFEDLIYRYSETTSRIRAFLSLGGNCSPKKFFIPEESEANTRVFEKYGKKKEIDIIEKKLHNYLYDFTNVVSHNIVKKVFDDNPKSEKYSFMKK